MTALKKSLREQIDGLLEQLNSEGGFTLDDVAVAAYNEFGRAFLLNAGKKWMRVFIRKHLQSRRAEGRVRLFQNFISPNQLRLWKSINELTEEEARLAFGQRKEGIEADVRSLKRDLKYWNKKVRRPDEKRIQLRFNFE